MKKIIRKKLMKWAITVLAKSGTVGRNTINAVYDEIQ